MQAARWPRADRNQERLFVITQNKFIDSTIVDLDRYLRPGDVLIVNDAATLPGLLQGRTKSGDPIEIRLIARLHDDHWQAVLFGKGDWRTPTELRAPPPILGPGDTLEFGSDARNQLCAVLSSVHPLSPRLVTLDFKSQGHSFWGKIYQLGKPIQYSYMANDLKLWSVQNVYSARPWAFEMPSAGHALSWSVLLALLHQGIQIAPLTHAAGLSSTGDPVIDRALPLAERFEIPPATHELIVQAKKSGGRVIAVGTSVVRALESAAQGIHGETQLHIGPGYRLRVVDGLLTGTHDVSESHYQLLNAFLSHAVLESASRHLENSNYLTHEFGDSCLIIK